MHGVVAVKFICKVEYRIIDLYVEMLISVPSFALTTEHNLMGLEENYKIYDIWSNLDGQVSFIV